MECFKLNTSWRKRRDGFILKCKKKKKKASKTASCRAVQRAIGEDYRSGRCSDADRMGGELVGFETPGAFPSSSAMNTRGQGAGGARGLLKEPEEPRMLQPSPSRTNQRGLAAL